MSERIEQSKVLFDKLYNCSQSVLGVFSEELGMPQDMAFKVASSFGSGARCGNICGAVSGALMVIGLKHGNSQGDDRKQKDIAKAQVLEFLKRFKELNGSLLCKDLLGCKGQADGYRKTCINYVADAVEILESMGY